MSCPSQTSGFNVPKMSVFNSRDTQESISSHPVGPGYRYRSQPGLMSDSLAMMVIDGAMVINEVLERKWRWHLLSCHPGDRLEATRKATERVPKETGSGAGTANLAENSICPWSYSTICQDGLVEACGETALPYRTVARWLRAFNEGRDRVENMVRAGRPSVSEEEVQAIFALFHPPHSPDLSPCDYDLIPKMKEPLRDVLFRTVPDILQAVGRSIRNINRKGAATGILRLPHLWQRVVDNAGYYIEGL
ncbi:hypothetical protein ANN_15562 [Periplaneta americana]|uniref:Uncharacterized protein n=1 Tax=Periplaneta americana TaxID=6978 RepID=A0ABQ8SGP8_PERAM|nr:hypothetical protein ANN_15562 [Periplaneta americana]